MKEKKGVKIDRYLIEKDDEIIAQYDEEGPWGLSCAIDLHECDEKIIKDEKMIRFFVKELISFIDMKAYKDTHIMNFGETPRISGISMFQFIETSCISAHFANSTKSAYIDIFSCRKFHPHEASAFCKHFFKTMQMKVQVEFRH